MNLDQYFALGWEALIFEPLYETYVECSDDAANYKKKIIQLPLSKGQDFDVSASVTGIEAVSDEKSETCFIDPRCTKLHAIGQGSRAVKETDDCSPSVHSTRSSAAQASTNCTSSVNGTSSADKRTKTIPLPFLSARQASGPLSPSSPTSSSEEMKDCRGKKAVSELIYNVLTRCVGDEMAYQEDIFVLEHYSEVKNLERLNQLLSSNFASSTSSASFLRRVHSASEQSIGGQSVAEHLSSAVRTILLQRGRESSEQFHAGLGPNTKQKREKYFMTAQLSEAQQRHLRSLLHDGVEYAALLTKISLHNHLTQQSGVGAVLPPAWIETAPHGARYGDSSQLLCYKYPPPYLRESTFTLETLRLYTWLKTWIISAAAAARRLEVKANKPALKNQKIRRKVGRKSKAISRKRDLDEEESHVLPRTQTAKEMKSGDTPKPQSSSLFLEVEPSSVISLSSTSSSDAEEHPSSSGTQCGDEEASCLPSLKSRVAAHKKKAVTARQTQNRKLKQAGNHNGESKDAIPSLTVVSSSSSCCDDDPVNSFGDSNLLSTSGAHHGSGKLSHSPIMGNILESTESKKDSAQDTPLSHLVGVVMPSPMLAYQEDWRHPRFPPVLPPSLTSTSTSSPISVHSTNGRVGYVDAYGNTLRSARLAAREAEMAAAQARREKKRSRLRGYFPLSLSRTAALIQEDAEMQAGTTRTSSVKQNGKKKRSILAALPSLKKNAQPVEKNSKGKKIVGRKRKRSPAAFASPCALSPSSSEPLSRSISSSSFFSSENISIDESDTEETGRNHRENKFIQRKRGRRGSLDSSSTSVSSNGSSKSSSSSSRSSLCSSSTEDSLEDIREDDFFDDVSSSYATNTPKESVISNLAILSGSHGSGKTAAVYLAASLLNCRVVELNTSVIRTPKTLATLVAELTKSQQHMSKWKDPYYSLSHSTTGEVIAGPSARSSAMQMLPPPPPRRRTIQEELERMKQQLDAEEAARQYKRKREGTTDDDGKQSDETLPGKRRKKTAQQSEPQQKKNAISAQAIASFFAPKKVSTTSSPPPETTNAALPPASGKQEANGDILHGSLASKIETQISNATKGGSDEKKGATQKESNAEDGKNSTKRNEVKGTLAFFFSPKAKKMDTVEDEKSKDAKSIGPSSLMNDDGKKDNLAPSPTCCSVPDSSSLVSSVTTSTTTVAGTRTTENDNIPVMPAQRDVSLSASPSAMSTILLVEDADVLLGVGEEQHGKALYTTIRDMAQESQIPIIVTANTPPSAPHHLAPAGCVNSWTVGTYPFSGPSVLSSRGSSFLSLLQRIPAHKGSSTSFLSLQANLMRRLLCGRRNSLIRFPSSDGAVSHLSIESLEELSNSVKSSNSIVKGGEEEEEQLVVDDSEEDDDYGDFEVQNGSIWNAAAPFSSSTCRGVSPLTLGGSSSSGRNSPTSQPLFPPLPSTGGGGGALPPASYPLPSTPAPLLSRRGVGSTTFSPSLVAQYFGPSAPLVYFTPPTRLSLYITLLITGAVELQLLQRVPISENYKKFKGEGLVADSSLPHPLLSNGKQYRHTVLCISNPSLFLSFSEFLEELVFGLNPSLVKARKRSTKLQPSSFGEPVGFSFIPLSALMRYKSHCSTTTDVRYWLNQLHFHLLLSPSQQRWFTKWADSNQEDAVVNVLSFKKHVSSEGVSLTKSEETVFGNNKSKTMENQGENAMDDGILKSGFEHSSLEEGSDWRWWWDVALGRYLRLYAQYHFPRYQKSYYHWLWENIYEPPCMVTIPVQSNDRCGILFNSTSSEGTAAVPSTSGVSSYFGLEKSSSSGAAAGCSPSSPTWTTVERSTLATELHTEDAARVLTLRYNYLLSLSQAEEDLKSACPTQSPKESRGRSSPKSSKKRSSRRVLNPETPNPKASQSESEEALLTSFFSVGRSSTETRGEAAPLATVTKMTASHSSLKAALASDVTAIFLAQLPSPIPIHVEQQVHSAFCGTVLIHPTASSFSSSLGTYDGGKSLACLMLPAGLRQRRLFSWLRLQYDGEGIRPTSYATALAPAPSSITPHSAVSSSSPVHHHRDRGTLPNDVNISTANSDESVRPSASMPLPLFSFSPPELHHQHELSRITGGVPSSALVIPGYNPIPGGPASAVSSSTSISTIAEGKTSWNTDASVSNSSNNSNNNNNNNCNIAGGASGECAARESVSQKIEDNEQALLFRLMSQGFQISSAAAAARASTQNSRGRAQAFLWHSERELRSRTVSSPDDPFRSEDDIGRRNRPGKRREEEKVFISSPSVQRNMKAANEKIAQSFIFGRDISSFEDILGFPFLLGKK